ncbi:MAG: recombinase family protein, partial [Candidatus Zixiibacteriota bacterium]
MRSMRCAIYARYSSDMQKQTSIDDQIRECRQFISHKGWQVCEDHLYTDKAVSGTEVNRPGYANLKKFAFDRQFECVVVDDLSRLGRDAGESIHIFQELTVFGIGIASVSDGIETLSQSAKIPYYFKSIANELFLDELKAKIVRGMKGQVERGYSAGGRVYGYDAVPDLFENGEQDKFGRPKRHGVHIRINDREAEVVRKIFEMRKLGMGYRAIAYELNAKGIPSAHAGNGSRSGHWCLGQVRSMLRQEKYTGDWTWNKTKWFKKNITGKRLKIDNPPDKWIVHKDESLRIVPQQLWNAVHGESNPRNAPKPSRSRPANGKYPLSGLLVCAECGSSYIITSSSSYSAYICNGYWSRGTTVCACNHRIRRQAVEDAVFGKLSELLLSEETCQRLADHINSRLKASWQSPEARRAELLRQKSSLSKAVENLLDVAEAGGLTESLRERLVSKESQLLSIERELASLSNRKSIPTSVDAEWVKSKLSGLGDLLQRHTDSMSVFRATLRNIFPGKLSVGAEETDGTTVFRISGNAMPLNALGETEVPIEINSGAGT